MILGQKQFSPTLFAGLLQENHCTEKPANRRSANNLKARLCAFKQERASGKNLQEIF
jgi:hypothetical protein